MRTRSYMLPLQAKLYTKDEELGKRDDDFRPKKKDTMSAQFNPMRWRKRRLIGILGVLAIVYLFLTNLPNGLGPADLRINPAFRPPRPGSVGPGSLPRIKKETAVNAGQQTATITGVDGATTTIHNVATPAAPQLEPKGAPPRDGSSEIEKQYFDGPIRYYKLAASLNKVSLAGKVPPITHSNVVFAASSLKSVANLLPIACEMASTGVNSVHFMLSSRSDLTIDDIRSINGLKQAECPIELHDARADYAEYSTDHRHEHVVAGAIAHLNAHLSPHAIIVDDQAVEDKGFSRAVQRRAKEYFRALIEIPAGRYDELMYISQLDYASLSHWHTPTIEIIIHAQKDSAGGLMRLLRDLGNADYHGIRLPKLTIDLATNIPQALKNVLGGYRWPSRYEPASMDVDTITLRHHVQTQRLSTEQAALRFLESYYPANYDNHVLILSPQVELSPQFLRYLHYTILEYKYKASKSLGTGELLGMSLGVPNTEIDGSTPFTAPEVNEKLLEAHEDPKTSFLYQAPSASSLLIFGDKWQVFHDYLTHRSTASHLGKAARAEKVVSETEPAWLEYLLELMRARGWHVLYPAHSFATVHNELAQIPEEFVRDASSTTQPAAATATPLSAEEPFILAPETPVIKPHAEERLPTVPLHQSLPYGGNLPKLDELPYLSYEGGLISMTDTDSVRAEYVLDFRKRIGGCSDADAGRPRIVQDGNAEDLFCLPDINMVFDHRMEPGPNEEETST